MKKLAYLLLALVGLTVFAACNDEESYADQKKEERSAIARYIADSSVTVINEATFAAQGYTTDVSKNEFVLFASSGIYMQIVRKGCGSPIANGKTVTVLCRFTERNLKTDSVQLSNEQDSRWDAVVDKMTVTRNSADYTGYFVKGESLLQAAYGNSSTAVPQGWLMPLGFINVGRPAKAGDEVARVRIIVPHDKGHAYATRYVYPCLYDLTYELGR
ncbi:MAG TPA: DUF4827 domain-containing protein [Prevotella sp.]|nr:DUF4827 domain-containing protein [Prevotella sp.]